MIDETVLIEEIERRIDIRSARALYFDGRVCSSCAVIIELRELIQFINKQKKK